MFRQLKNVGTFLLEWFKLASIGGSVVTWIVKAMIFFPTLLFALSDNTKLDVHFLTKTDEEVVETTLNWQPTIGWAVFVSVLGVWLAIAGGITWARFKRLEIGEALEFDHGPDPGYGWNIYRLPICNLGGDIVVPVYAEAIADEKGILDVPQLPVELSWLHEEPNSCPVLSRNVIRKVNVFKAWGKADPKKPNAPTSGKWWGLGIVFLGKNKKEVCAGTVSPHETKKLWIAIAIGDHDTKRWFSVEADDDEISSCKCKIELDKPPFLKSR